MSYSTGMLRYRVTILNKQAATAFGETTGYVPAGTVWAAVDFQRGLKHLAEGALDGTDYVVIRMRYNNIVKRDSQLECNGVTYQVNELHADRMDNIIQIKATETVK